MKQYRTEHDSMGEVLVPADTYWGAQTQRSIQNFPIGEEKMPWEIIHAFALLKRACATANRILRPRSMTTEKCAAIALCCDEILQGQHKQHFPLSVWQTGSGTQTNIPDLMRDAKLTLVSSVSIVEGGAHDVTLRSTSTHK